MRKTPDIGGDVFGKRVEKEEERVKPQGEHSRLRRKGYILRKKIMSPAAVKGRAIQPRLQKG